MDDLMNHFVELIVDNDDHEDDNTEIPFDSFSFHYRRKRSAEKEPCDFSRYRFKLVLCYI